MTKVVAYGRGIGGVRGSTDSLPFWRRIRLPLTMLAEQKLFSSFSIHTLREDEELTVGMLQGPDMVVLHNFVPASLQEEERMHVVSEEMRRAGHLPSFIYDLEDPELLHEASVLSILPLMRMITVPNPYLMKEVDTLSRVSSQRVVETPSTFDFAVFQNAPRQHILDFFSEDRDAFGIGCFGNHDWDPLLPAIFSILRERQPTHLSRLVILTDSQRVGKICLDSQIHFIGYNDSTMSATLYPQTLACCSIGLLPRQGKDGRDTCWLAEYGAVNAPCMMAKGSSYETFLKGNEDFTFLPYDDPERWADQLLYWMSDVGQEDYQHRVTSAYLYAMLKRVAMQSPNYAHYYRKILPVSPHAL